MFHFVTALAILHQDDLKKGMNSSYCSFRHDSISLILHIVLVQFILFFKSSWCKLASVARNYYCPPPPQAAVMTFFFSSGFRVSILSFYMSMVYNFPALRTVPFGFFTLLRRRLIFRVQPRAVCSKNFNN